MEGRATFTIVASSTIMSIPVQRMSIAIHRGSEKSDRERRGAKGMARSSSFVSERRGRIARRERRLGDVCWNPGRPPVTALLYRDNLPVVKVLTRQRRLG